MPIAPEVAEKAKAQLLAEFLQQHADEINGEASKQQQNSSSSKQQAPKQLSAQEVAKRKQKFEAEFEKRYRVGGTGAWPSWCWECVGGDTGELQGCSRLCMKPATGFQFHMLGPPQHRPYPPPFLLSSLFPAFLCCMPPGSPAHPRGLCHL